MLFLLVPLAAIAIACANATPIAPTPTPTHTPRPTATPTPDPVGEPVPDAERAMEHVRKLSVDIGPRVAGTPGEIEARDYLRDTLESYGYDVRLQQFTFDSSAFLPARLEAGDQEIAAFAFRGSPSTTATGPLVDAGLGRPESLAGAQGAIALMQRGELTFGEKVANAIDAGAVAVVVYNNEEGSLLGDLGGPVTIPAVGITREEGEALLASLSSGEPLEATVTVSTPQGTAYNVIAMPPDVESCKTVTGGHYDSVASPGADDNASGTASVLETARVVAAADLAGDHCFVLFSAEELGLFGSQEYVDSLSAQEIADIEAMVNLDVVGLDEPLSLIGTPDLVEAARIEAQRLVIEASASQLPNGSGSDHLSFQAAGVPVLMLFRPDPLIHTANDTVDRIHPPSLEEVVRITVAMLETLTGP